VALATRAAITRRARARRSPARFRVVMPDPLDIPAAQRFSRLVAGQRVRVLRVVQLPLQRRRLRVMRTQRRMPLAAGAPIVPAECKHALPLCCVPFQRSHALRHLSRRPPLMTARFDERTKPASHPQTAHSREQLPKFGLLCRAARHTGGIPAHKPCSSVRVSAHGLQRSYG
jgi:hypothetical protein